jgi:hypothetical protein
MMSAGHSGELTALLDDVRAGRPTAEARLVCAFYGELRRMAGGLMRRERPDHALQPSALVHEALLRLLSGQAIAGAPDRHLEAIEFSSKGTSQLEFRHTLYRGYRNWEGGVIVVMARFDGESRKAAWVTAADADEVRRTRRCT